MEQQMASSPEMGLIPVLFILGFVGLLLASMWKVFAKAGQPGWAAIVPIYNLVVMCQLAKKPGWFVVLFFIPLVSLYASFAVPIGLARSFGKGTGFGIGLAILPMFFYPMLAFGDASYEGDAPAPLPAPPVRAA